MNPKRSLSQCSPARRSGIQDAAVPVGPGAGLTPGAGEARRGGVRKASDHSDFRQRLREFQRQRFFLAFAGRQVGG